MMERKVWPYLALILLFACGQKSSSFKPGSTTKSEIIAALGNPVKEESPPVKDGSVLVYEGDQKFQLKGQVLHQTFRRPEKDEKLLLYWKHKFRECLIKEDVLTAPQGAHTPPERELKCEKLGMSVVYTEGSDTVSRVVEYEAQ